MAESEAGPTVDHAAHTRYWLRCLKTYLPTAYTSTDSNRMFLGFTIVTALDVLGVLHDEGKVKESERSGIVEWIYGCQHPEGGFRAFPGTNFGAERRTRDNSYLDPANAAGTVFALASLVVLRDNLERVDRQACLGWLRKLQADDGSFAEILGPEGKPEGKRDPRHSYFAAATRYILAIPTRAPEIGGDIDQARLLDSIYASQSYDGGIGQGPGMESHGGYGFCAVAALKLLGELPDDPDSKPSTARARDLVDRLIEWVVQRQEYDVDPEVESGDENSASGDVGGDTTGDSLKEESSDKEGMSVDRWLGFNGRCNKLADTCYSFWVGGTINVGLCDPTSHPQQRLTELELLGMNHLIDTTEHRRFLVERTQHRFGGFGKLPGDLPDILHAYTGLLALSFFGDRTLAEVDSPFGISKAARDHLEKLRTGFINETIA